MSVVYFSCDKSVEQVTYEAPVQEDPPGSMHYTIRLKASAACPITPIPPPPLSGGSLFLILFGVAAVVYLGAGAFYNYRVRELRGMDIIPQWQARPSPSLGPVPRPVHAQHGPSARRHAAPHAARSIGCSCQGS